MSITVTEVASYYAQTGQLANELSCLCSNIAIDRKIRVILIEWSQKGVLPENDTGEPVFKCDEVGEKYGSLSSTVSELSMPVLIFLNGHDRSWRRKYFIQRG